MDNKKTYSSTSHKIRLNWEDIAKLIALEEDLMRRIEEVEASLEKLWKAQANIAKG